MGGGGGLTPKNLSIAKESYDFYFKFVYNICGDLNRVKKTIEMFSSLGSLMHYLPKRKKQMCLYTFLINTDIFFIVFETNHNLYVKPTLLRARSSALR